MPTAQDVINQIQSQATSHAPDVKRIATMRRGESIRQGDVYLTRISSIPARIESVTLDRQLAPGTTKGSRHIVAAKSKATIYAPPPSSTDLSGPTIDCPTRRLVIEHPEHGWIDLPRGTYQVTYQRDYKRERAEELRRVAD